MPSLRVVKFELEDASEEVIRTALTAAFAGLETAPAPAPQRPVPVEIVEAAPEVERVAAPVRKALKAPAEKPAAPSGMRQAAGGGESIRMRILEAIGKKPSSGLELSHILKLELGQIYPATHELKKSGHIEGREDAIDGTRRWYVIAK
jgi:hypothetical protein